MTHSQIYVCSQSDFCKFGLYINVKAAVATQHFKSENTSVMLDCWTGSIETFVVPRNDLDDLDDVIMGFHEFPSDSSGFHKIDSFDSTCVRTSNTRPEVLLKVLSQASFRSPEVTGNIHSVHSFEHEKRFKTVWNGILVVLSSVVVFLFE